MAENVEVVVSPVVVEDLVDPIEVKDKEIARLSSDLENYKHVALKRLGKNPGDADFVAGIDEKTGLTIQETINKTLIEGEVAKVIREKDEIARKFSKENAELRLALKNRPGAAIGGGSGESSVVVKDNILSDQQLATIRSRGEKLHLSGEKLDAFVEKAKQNLLKNR